MCFDPISLLASIGSAISTGVSAISGAVGSVAGSAGLSGNVLSVITGGLSAVGSIVGGIQQNNAAKATARAQEQAALDRLRQGEEESDRRRRAGAIALGNQRAAMAANGIDVGSDYALNLYDESLRNIEDDAFAIRDNATREGQQLNVAAANSRAQGQSALFSGFMDGAGTMLTTAGKVAGRWRKPARIDPWQGMRGAGYAYR